MVPQGGEENSKLKTLAAILFAFWVLGFTLHAAGGTIHLLPGIALAVLLVDMIAGRRRAV